MAEADLRNMIMNFRVSDLQVLLGFAGRNKTGKKQELQSRALDLVKLKSPAVEMKIKELHNRRYNHHQLLARPSNYEIPDRTLADRSLSNYESAMNNNYALRCNPNTRPMSMNQGPSQSYAGKPYMPPIPTQSHYSPYADVKFKDLPFFDTLHVLLRPFSLVSDTIDRCQESVYSFTLSPQEAHDLAVSKDASGNYECQILLRFCIVEAGSEQDDNFPPNISVKVNGKLVPLPNPIPTNRPGVEPKRPSKPVNITPYAKLSPTVTNNITITWSSSYGRSYAAVLYVARLLTSMTLLQRLKTRGIRSAELTKAMIIEKLQQGQDADIATTSLQASLICPLGKLKMELPCRAVTCSHIACFDALLYIQLNEKKPKWRCPVCDKPALFKNLVIDGMFMEIVSKVLPECSDVQLHDDGSWSPIMPMKESKEVKKVMEQTKKSSPPKTVDIIDISSDSDSEDLWKSASKSSHGAFDSPPVVQIAPETNLLPPCPTPPVAVIGTQQPMSAADYANTPLFEPVPVCLTANYGATDLQSSEHLNILPDLGPPDNSLPSTSNSGLGCSMYPVLSSDSSAYCGVPNPMPNLLSEQSDPNTEKYLDLYSLLSIPESEQQKFDSLQKELMDKDPTPDVISID